MKVWPNWVDLIVVIIVFTACYNGFSRGLLTSGLRLLGLVVSTLIAVNGAGMVAERIQAWVGAQPALTTFLVFWVVFLALVLTMRAVVNAIAKVVKWEPVNWITQWLGLVLGGLRGAWWAGLFVLTLSVSGFGPVQESVEQRSMSAPYVLPVFHDYVERLSDRLPGAATRSPTLIPPVY